MYLFLIRSNSICHRVDLKTLLKCSGVCGRLTNKLRKEDCPKPWFPFHRTDLCTPCDFTHLLGSLVSVSEEFGLYDMLLAT